jgi:hypothetical protein
MQEKKIALEAELCIEFDGPQRVPVGSEAQYTEACSRIESILDDQKIEQGALI